MYMREVNITELRNHLPKYLSNVSKSDEILVTLHGKVIARILPMLNARGIQVLPMNIEIVRACLQFARPPQKPLIFEHRSAVYVGYK